MIKNHFKTAWRNSTRNKLSTTINIAGLALGFASVLLISLYVGDEQSYDRFFTNADRIYQVNMDLAMGGQAAYVSNTPPTAGPALKESFPEIETYTRLYVMGDRVVSSKSKGEEEKQFIEKAVLAVDSNFLQVFDYAVLQGNRATCLENPHSIVVTQSATEKYFGKEEAIGRNLMIDGYTNPFVVTAVLKNIPTQSSIQFDLLIPTAAAAPVQQFSWSWVWLQMNTYVLLDKHAAKDPASIHALESKFPSMVRTQAVNAFERIGQPFDEFIQKGGKWDIHLQPLTRVHLHSAGISTPFLSNLGEIKYHYCPTKIIE